MTMVADYLRPVFGSMTVATTSNLSLKKNFIDGDGFASEQCIDPGMNFKSISNNFHAFSEWKNQSNVRILYKATEN